MNNESANQTNPTSAGETGPRIDPIGLINLLIVYIAYGSTA